MTHYDCLGGCKDPCYCACHGEMEVYQVTTTKTYQRASEHVQGIGDSLPLGEDYLLIKFSTDKRNFGGELRTIVYLTLAPMDDINAEKEYHAWSDSLAERLGELADGLLPLIIKFKKVRTRAGFDVLTFE